MAAGSQAEKGIWALFVILTSRSKIKGEIKTLVENKYKKKDKIKASPIRFESKVINLLFNEVAFI